LYALEYQVQLAQKKQKVAGLLTPFYQESLKVFDSPDSHYRARAEFRIWHEGDRCDYAMGNSQKKGAITIEECPKVIKPIEKRMWKLIEKINASPTVLKQRLFAVEFLATPPDQ
jgi:tRNA (uracil-5-)-methyltransferase